jgi:ribosomal protein L18E
MKLHLYTTLSLLVFIGNTFAQQDNKSVTKQSVETLQKDRKEVIEINVNHVIKDAKTSNNDSIISESKVVIKTVLPDGSVEEQVMVFKNVNEAQVERYIDSIKNQKTVHPQSHDHNSCKIKVLNMPEIPGESIWIDGKEGIKWMDIDNLSDFTDLQMLEENKPFLGVVLDDENVETEGIRILSVVEGSAAQLAGLQKEDIIIGIDGIRVVELKALMSILREKTIGDTVEIEALRNNNPTIFNAQLKSRADCNFNLSNTLNFKTPSCCTKEIPCEHHQRTYKALSYTPGPRLGVNIEDLDDEMIADLKIKKGNGVLVTKVYEASTAEKIGLKVNDVITQINDTPIEGIVALQEFLAGQQLGSNFKMIFIRYGKQKTVSGEFNEFDFPKFDINN